MAGRGAIQWAAMFVVAAGLVGCGQTRPAAPTRPLVAEVRIFLPRPDQAVEIDDPRANALHSRLLAGEDPAQIADLAELALSLDRSLAAMSLVLAEARLVAGDAEGSLAALAALDAEVRARPGVQLVEGRSLESAGRLVDAYELYRRVEAPDSPATARADALEAGVAAELRRLVDQALSRSRLDQANLALDRLREWWPHDPGTLDALRRVAAASGNTSAERAALLALAANGLLAAELELRLAELELEAGETDSALRILETLARRSPGDELIAESLDRARFRWRIGHSPESVQRAAGRAQLSRADLARLLYWLAPGIRSERGAVGRIASDVVGHAAQEEIIRVVNLGLMRLDETLHRFDPERPARRGEALEATLRGAATTAAKSACGAVTVGGSWSRDQVCESAARCGLIADVASCLPGGPLSGAEALEWIRLGWRVQERIGE